MQIEISRDVLVDNGLSPEAASEIVDKVKASDSGGSAADIWGQVARDVLSPDIPFPVHRYLHEQIFKDWDLSQGPPPAWTPTEAEIASSNVAAFSKKMGLPSADELHRWSADYREAFWGGVIDTLGIKFKQGPSSVVDMRLGLEAPRWLPGAKMNIAESCFLAPPDAPAIIYQEEGGEIGTATYGELDRLSNRFARSISALGLPSDASIAIVMRMSLEAVAAYLGVVKAGFAVSSIADSFAPDEIATRVRLSNALVAVTQDVTLRGGKTLPMYQKVVDAGVKQAVVVYCGPRDGISLRDQDVAWEDFLSDDDTFEAVARDPDDITAVLFSSGTTGDPKAIPWTHTTPLKCGSDGYFHQDIKPGEVVAWPTSIGWMMGSWLIYATLLNRATISLYYGSPVSREFCEHVQNAGVNMLGVIPSMVKAWQNGDLAKDLDWSSIRLFSSTGECSNADDYLYLMSLARYRPIIEYCGGTELGGGYVSGTTTRPASPAVFSAKCFGLDFYILDEMGKETTTGELYLVPPSIGLSNVLLNRDHHHAYYEDTPTGPKGELLRRHGDEIERLPGGYYRGHGRADDTMNLGGIKVSSAEIERSLTELEGVVETAAVAVDPPGGGPSQLVVYAVMASGEQVDTEALRKDMQRAVAGKLNPLFKIQDVILVDKLPRTASNKVMRRVLRDQYRA